MAKRLTRMERYLGIILIFSLFFFSKNTVQTPIILGESKSQTEPLPVSQPVTTQSAFTQKLEEQIETLPKKTVFQDDPETEAGEEKVLDEGEDGKKTRIAKITYLKSGEEYSRQTVSVDIKDPKDKKILRGTKIVWRTLDSADGQIRYWKKLRVYATHYDSHCLGCNQWTAIGMQAGFGVIAADPKVIPLRSKVYIPGYGMAVAGDTGGAIKGNIIDLGFDDVKTANWKARFVDIYLL